MAKMYSVRFLGNEYSGHENSYKIAKLPSIIYYIHGPGGPGPHGILHSPEMYYASSEEAERMLPMLEQAYHAGRRDKRRELVEALNSD